MFANFDVTPSFLFMVLLACNKLQPSKTQVDCSDFPCFNGGTCVPGPPDMCSCPPGFFQPFCTKSCQDSRFSCVNGVCVGDVCNCDTNFAGPRCKSAIAAYLSPMRITVAEGHVGQKAVTIQVCRQPSSEEVTLAVNTNVGSASASFAALPDVDFVNIPIDARQDVTISAGQPCTPVNIFIISDLTQETMSKSFFVLLIAPQSSSSMIQIVPTGSNTFITITDDDPGCLMEPCQNGGTCSDDVCSCSQGFVGPSCQSTIAVYLDPLEVSVTEANVGDDISVQIHVCRQQSTLTTTVTVTTSQDSAMTSSDFAHISTPVTIPIGKLCVPVDISIVSDMITEPTEVFHVLILPIQLPSSVYIVFGQGTATVTILDDDDTEPPVITNCPFDSSRSIVPGTSSTSISWAPPTASDNSGDVTLMSSHQPGDTFSLGQTTVTYTATDGTGNTEQCQFVITVIVATELEIQFMDIINTITRENTTTKEVVMASERIAEISDRGDFLEEDPKRIELLISSLESVVRAGEASINVTDPVVRSINNLMNLDRGILEDGMIEGGRAVVALEGQITNFQTIDGNFSTVLDNVGVTAVKIDARSVGSSLAYANFLPENETLLMGGAFQEGNTQLFSDGDAIPLDRTATSISVPSSVLDLLGGAGVELTAVPVTFIIYGNDVLFRPSMPTEVEENYKEEIKSTVTERVASQIISAIIRTGNTRIVNLPPGSPVITTFLSNLTIGVGETIEARDCVDWSYNENTGEGFWTKDGCETIFRDNRDLTMCSCDRLGSFAILIRVRKGPMEAQVTLYYITLIGSIISGLALVGCLTIFVCLK